MGYQGSGGSEIKRLVGSRGGRVKGMLSSGVVRSRDGEDIGMGEWGILGSGVKRVIGIKGWWG